MKKDTHPTYFKEAIITCSCGNAFSTGSVIEAIQVEVCSNCHPFFTGKQKFLDAARRVEKFQERTKKTADAKAVRSTVSKKAKRKVKDSKKIAKDVLKKALKEA